MEDATPIFALKDESNNIRKQPLEVVSYSDVLRNMEAVKTPTAAKTSLADSSPPPHAAPLYPPVSYPTSYNHIVQSQPAPSDLSKPAPSDLPKPAPVDNMQKFQNEMIVLLVSYIVIHMSTVQEWIRGKLPNIVSPETGAMTVLGLLTNGVLLIVLWNVAKKLILKYMQDVEI